MNAERKRVTLYEAVKRIRHFIAGVATLGPLLWLKGDAPPYLFGGAAAALSFIGIAFMIVGFAKGSPRPLMLSVAMAVLAIVMFPFYKVLLLEPFTAVHEQNYRKQIGFRFADWSLTCEAKDYIQTHSIRTPIELLDGFSAWNDSDISGELWFAWTVVAAGILILLAYLAIVFTWSFAIGHLCQYLASEQGQLVIDEGDLRSSESEAE